jgi:DGQHR domain-containing protein
MAAREGGVIVAQTNKVIKKPPSKGQKSAEEKAKIRKEKARDRAFTAAHRRIFERAGFTRLQPVDGIHFTYQGIKSELDDIFVFENVAILAEYTRTKSSNLGTHCKGKAGIHNKISENPIEFIDFFADLSGGVSDWIKSIPYTPKQLIVILIYCSNDAPEDHHKALFKSTFFISDAERGYFKSLTKAIKKSSRFEIFEFLGINPLKVGQNGAMPTNAPVDQFCGVLLPEEQSHFPSGFSVVSFYVDPESLLSRSYVLRRNGWRDGLRLYQRAIIPAKIASIRQHLKDKQRVFANNIVVTLPPESHLSNTDGTLINHSEIAVPTPIHISIPRKPNSVGIIDGQHRVFSYYEDLEPDEQIDKFRKQQNLLATGLIYPAKMSISDREKFEAGLFLEINSTQSSASSEIKQAIWLVLDPFKPVSVARMVLINLTNTAPLKGFLARTSLDAGKIRTSSIVSYGLMPLTKRSGIDSLFHIWPDAKARSRLMAGKKNSEDLEAYIEFCTTTVSDFLSEVREAVGSSHWRISEKQNDGILSVTTINGLIILMRKLIEAKKFDEAGCKLDLEKLNKFAFRSYKSSQYGEMASQMYDLIS